VAGAAAAGVEAAYYLPCFRDELRLTSLTPRLRLLTIIIVIIADNYNLIIYRKRKTDKIITKS